MTVKFIFCVLGLTVAHQAVGQLVAPDYDFHDDGTKIDELTIFQLLALFRSSAGIVMGLPDGAFSASDEYDANHGVIYARIGANKVAGKSHAWCGVSGVGGEITVDLTTSHLVTGVATQGRGSYGHEHIVTLYSIETSEDGLKWTAQGSFQGNFDSTTICRRRFKKPVLASFVKFTVLDYKGHPCTRLDVLVYERGDD